MKKKSIKERLKKEKMLIGWLSIPSTVIAEIIARAGFDAVAVDMEHSAIEFGSIEPLVQVIEGNHSHSIVRVPNNDPVLIKRLLDLGVEGIIVPMVKTAEEARLAVGASKYPPEGFRSTGIYRAQGYGSSFKDYRFSANENIIIILQIEHKDAVDNIDQILGTPGIDAIMIGPYDLSSSYGIAGELDHSLMKEAVSKVMKSARKHNVKVGFHVVEPSTEMVIEKLNEDFSFVVYSNDSIILDDHYRKAVVRVAGKVNNES